jgi:hypothetical protein
LYFGFISLLAGAFIGISVFFIYYNAPQIFPAPKTVAVKETTEEKIVPSPTLELDTVNVVAENFILSASTPKTKTQPENEVISPAVIDTAEVLHTKPLTVPSSVDKLQEIQVKYIPNAPIIFLHDLKITNYSSLYFKRNKFVTLTSHKGLDPSYANKDELRKYDNVFSSADNYYLHEAIGEAMLYFSKKDFNRCLRTLQVIRDINPDDINVHFYSGMCYYYKKNYTAAIANLESCINNSNNSFVNEAQFYKAMSMNEQGNKSEALELFKQIASEGGFYAEKAKGFLN